MKSKLSKITTVLSLFIVSFMVTGCSESRTIVSAVDERQANVIVVFLESKGISAYKEKVVLGASAAMESGVAATFNIQVDNSQAIEAMAILNSNGLPHKQGTNLLELFAKQGLMSTDKEETIRYQAGLAQQIANMILMIDGVIDANVQISFPQEESIGSEGMANQRVTAAIFVKHQGIIDDPNTHLESKIKRLVSGSVNGLDINDVTVVSDRSRFTDISINGSGEHLGSKGQEYVRIWSMVMSRDSAHKFRSVFIFLLAITILLALAIGWILWKIYPILKSRGGFNELLNPIPLMKKITKNESTGPKDGGV